MEGNSWMYALLPDSSDSRDTEQFSPLVARLHHLYQIFSCIAFKEQFVIACASAIAFQQFRSNSIWLIFGKLLKVSNCSYMG